MVGVTGNRIAQPEEDDRRDLRIVGQHVAEERVDLRFLKAFVVLKARNEQEAEPVRQRDFVRGDAQADRVEVVDLRPDLDDPGASHSQDSHGFGVKMQRQLGEIAPICRRIRYHQIDGAGVDATAGDQGGKQRIAERGEARLVEQRRSGRRIGLCVIADVRAELFGDRERGEARAPKRDQERRGVIVVRAREGVEIGEVHRKLDAVRMRFRADAKRRDGQRGDQSDEQDDCRVARTGSKKRHEAGVFAQRRIFSAGESQKGSP